jgi:putative chitinase
MENEIIVNGDKSLLGIEVTLDQLVKIYPNQTRAVLAKNLDGLNKTLYRFGINENKYEVASFLAQVGHESAELKYKDENLNYSAQGLGKTFKKYFPTVALQNKYARNPKAIANRVYANRMGNGDEASGDGFKFKGKGYIQLTGKENTMKFAATMGMDETEVLKYLLTEEGAWMSAGWFWSTRGLDKYDDSPSLFEKLTRLINGGINGLVHRKEIYNKALAVL